MKSYSVGGIIRYIEEKVRDHIKILVQIQEK